MKDDKQILKDHRKKLVAYKQDILKGEKGLNKILKAIEVLTVEVADLKEEKENLMASGVIGISKVNDVATKITKKETEIKELQEMYSLNIKLLKTNASSKLEGLLVTSKSERQEEYDIIKRTYLKQAALYINEFWNTYNGLEEINQEYKDLEIEIEDVFKDLEIEPSLQASNIFKYRLDTNKVLAEFNRLGFKNHCFDGYTKQETKKFIDMSQFNDSDDKKEI